MLTLKEFMGFLREETHDEHFSFDELRKYVGLVQRLEYLNQTLGEAKYGSSRAVFNLSDALVLKVAINEKGLVQNETEYTLFHSAEPKVKEVLAAIKEPHDPEFQWIVMERVKPLEDEVSFEQVLGVTTEMALELFSGFCFTETDIEKLKNRIQSQIDYFSNPDHPNNRVSRWSKTVKVDPRIEKYRKMLNFTDEFAKLCLAVPHLESNGGDLGRLDQLGVTSDGRLVILDYGFGNTAFGMYNPSIYQQVAAQQRAEMDVDHYDYQEDRKEEYDKYGNKIKRPTRVNTKPATGMAKQQTFNDDDIPF